MGVWVPVGVGVGVGVGATVGVGGVVGVGATVGAGGVVMVSDGRSPGAGAGCGGAGDGWAGAAAAGAGLAAAACADGIQTGAAKDTCGVGTDDGDTAAGASGTVAGWPAWDDADGLAAVTYEARGAGAADDDWRASSWPAPAASCDGVSCPKNGMPKA